MSIPSDCINKNNLFYLSKPRISHNIYTADNFIGFIQTASELHWVTLREYHKNIVQILKAPYSMVMRYL